VLGFAACRIEEVPRTGRPDPAEVARKEIDATRVAYRQARLDADAGAIADLFTRDGTLSEPDAPDVVGPDAIEATLRRLFARTIVTDLLLEPDRLDIAAGGVANEVGRFEETVQTTNQPPVPVRARYAIRWLRGAEGDWQIDYLLYNLYPAADTSATR
jgi:ketosteroid isomerase-like protein